MEDRSNIANSNNSADSNNNVVELAPASSGGGRSLRSPRFAASALDGRWCAELSLRTPAGERWSLARVCEAVDIIVAVQHLALVDCCRYQRLVLERLPEVRIWLYELLVAASAMGLHEVAPTLIDALPGVDMSAYYALLDELGVLRPGALAAVAVGGAR